MTSETKKRIAQINSGVVPEGYKKTKIGIVPNDWREVLFSALFSPVCNYTDDLHTYPLYSLTIEDGITPKTDRYERSHLVKKANCYKIVRSNDYAYNPMNIRFGAVARNKSNISVAVSGYYDIFTTIFPSDYFFMDNFLTCDTMIAYYNKVATGSLIEKQRVHFSDFMEFSLPIPSLNERERIAEILSTQNKLIELKQKLINLKKQQKKWMMRQLFENKKIKRNFSSNWKTVELSEVFEYIQPTKYLVHDINYSNNYNIPVLTAGKTFVLGYTNETDGIYNDLPVVIFDDFTTDSKFVDFPFKVKSSAMKILKTKSGYDTKFAFTVLQNIKYIVGGHERHWISKFSQMTVDTPPYEVQKDIVKIIDSFDKEIELLEKELELQKQKKKALMQLLLTGRVRVNT